jgi:hypothetical protein
MWSAAVNSRECNYAGISYAGLWLAALSSAVGMRGLVG